MARKRKGATPHLRIRIEPGLLTRLEKSRTANNRTLTGEIVHRIEQTFRKSDDADLATLVYRAAFGERTGDLLRAFATAIWLIEKRTGKKWHEDRETARQVSRAIDEIIAWFTRQRRDPAMDAARLKYELSGDPSAFWVQSGAGLEKVEYYPTRVVADTAALEALQKMGMAPSDAEIDEAARADPKYLEAKEKYDKHLADREQEKGWLADGRKTVTKDDPKTKDEGEGP